MASRRATPHWLLPVTIVIGTIMIGMCLSDMRDVIASGQLFGHAAMAETESAHATKPETPPAPQQASATNSASEQEKTTSAPAEAPPSIEPPSISGPPPEHEETSPAEMDILKQLSTRREMLDRRAQDIDKREALLKIYEQRIEQKTKELTALRQQIQTLLGQANETQAAQLDNLVKIYETMKPDDAAKIFDTLDMPILLGVIQRMKPKSTAPIMAKMSSERAKEVTVSLLKQDKLPQIK